MRTLAGRRRNTAALAFVSILALISSGDIAAGSSQIPKEPIKWSAMIPPAEKPLHAGDQFAVQLAARIEEGWHLYSTEQVEGGPIPTRITLPADQPFEMAGTIESSEPRTAFDPNFNLTTEFYENEAFFSVPAKVATAASPGKAEVWVSVSFQTCNDQICLPPKTVKLGVPVNLAAGKQTTTHGRAGIPAPPQKRLQK